MTLIDPSGSSRPQPGILRYFGDFQPSLDCRRKRVRDLESAWPNIGWVRAPTNAHDTWFQPLLEVFQDKTVLLADSGFHAAADDPPNLKICKWGEWNECMLLETTFSISSL